MGNLFLTNDRDRADDFQRWAYQLDALGAAIGYLAESDKHEELSPLIYAGLADIVCEYARQFNETAQEAYHVLDDFYEGGGNKLASKLRRQLDYVSRNPRSESDLERIDDALGKISTSLADHQTLTELQGQFLELRKKCFAGVNSRGKKEVSSPAKAGNSED